MLENHKTHIQLYRVTEEGRRRKQACVQKNEEQV